MTYVSSLSTLARLVFLSIRFDKWKEDLLKKFEGWGIGKDGKDTLERLDVS